MAHLESRLQRKQPLSLDLTHFAPICECAALCPPLYLNGFSNIANAEDAEMQENKLTGLLTLNQTTGSSPGLILEPLALVVSI